MKLLLPSGEPTHFEDDEMWCKCCKRGAPNWMLLKILECRRREIGKAIIITSGGRCTKHNKHEGGTNTSEHLLYGNPPIFSAADYWRKGLDPLQEARDLEMAQYTANLGGMGIYYRVNSKGELAMFIHIDVGDAANSNGIPRRWIDINCRKYFLGAEIKHRSFCDVQHAMLIEMADAIGVRLDGIGG